MPTNPAIEEDRPMLYSVTSGADHTEGLTLAQAREHAAAIVSGSPAWLDSTYTRGGAYDYALARAEQAPEHGATIDLPGVGCCVVIRPDECEDCSEEFGRDIETRASAA